MSGRQGLREFWRLGDSLLSGSSQGLSPRGFLAGQALGTMPGGGVHLWEIPQRSCYPSCVYSHAVTVSRGPGTLEGLGSSDLIRSSHTDDRDMQRSCAEGPNEPTGGRDFTATVFPVGWTLPRSSSLTVKGGRLDPSDRWGH